MYVVYGRGGSSGQKGGGMRWAAVGRKRGGARRLLPPPFENVLGREASPHQKDG